MSAVEETGKTHKRTRQYGQPAKTDLHQLCADAGYSLEDLLGAMDERDGWRERVMEIRAVSAT